MTFYSYHGVHDVQMGIVLKVQHRLQWPLYFKLRQIVILHSSVWFENYMFNLISVFNFMDQPYLLNQDYWETIKQWYLQIIITLNENDLYHATANVGRPQHNLAIILFNTKWCTNYNSPNIFLISFTMYINANSTHSKRTKFNR